MHTPCICSLRFERLLVRVGNAGVVLQTGRGE